MRGGASVLVWEELGGGGAVTWVESEWGPRGWGLTSLSRSSCFNGGTCVDSVDSFSCLCRPGYSGLHCQHEADPCLSRPCLHGGVCTSVHPGFRCTCPEGFEGTQCQVGSVTRGLGKRLREVLGTPRRGILSGGTTR